MNMLFIWYLWCHLFDPLPYGNPYVAMLAAVLLLAAFSMMIKKIMASTCQ